MPAASSSKRVKNTRVSRPYIIGSEAWTLTDETRPPTAPVNHTKGWRVYVRPLHSGPSISTWLKKVQFKLHHTYADASRTVETSPFEISETGYGEFDVELRLFFDAASGEKAQYRVHRLRLEPWGVDEEAVERMRRENLVRAETLDVVEFNEPSVDFFNKLTSEAQFGGAAGGAGRGKKATKGGGAKGRAAAANNNSEATAGFPEQSTDDSPWSLQLEQKMLDMLAAASAEADALIQTEKNLAQERSKRLVAAD